MRAENAHVEQVKMHVECPLEGAELVEDVVHYTPNQTSQWGSLLSGYWQARGVAALAGVRFNGEAFADSLLKYLPAKTGIDKTYKDAARLAEACLLCADTPKFPHMCNGAWTQIRPIAQRDTQKALEMFSVSEKLALPEFADQEVLLHLRLDPNGHQMQWPGRSTFEAEGVLPLGVRKIRIVHEPYRPEHFKALHVPDGKTPWHARHDFDHDRVRSFDTIIHGYTMLLQDICKKQGEYEDGCQVTSETGSRADDFIKIASAPNVICTGSTYCLYAALGNRGAVHFPVKPYWGGEASPSMPTWHWRSEVRLPNKEVAGFRGMSAEQVVDWMMSH